ncbi:MAG TPA: NAD-dependent epimerase/dehydratase family protein [Candidatus Omnitrophota bacterium]|nr:NAD-dependent epimerase/dehydratase family protein [Candidatus Omnitrophota bacterium]
MDYSGYFEGKTILITGGLGFIGSNMAIRLAELSPKEVIIVDSLVDGLGGNLGNISEIKARNNIRILCGSEWNIKNAEKIKPLIKEADVILNFAGSVKHTKLGEKELEFDTEINFISQVLFLESCRKVMIENPGKKLKIVFSGTRDQYGKVPFAELPVKEDFLPKEMTDYQSITKNAAESYHFILNNILREQGVDISINSLRLTNVYGPRQSEKSGSVIPVFVSKSIRDESIELWGGGEVLRDLNYIDDVINAFLIIASSDVHGEFFNLGCCIGKEDMDRGGIGNNLLTIKNLAEKVASLVGKGKIKVIPYPPERKAVEPGHFAADISKIYSLGWSPKTSLEEGLKRTIEWHKNKDDAPFHNL